MTLLEPKGTRWVAIFIAEGMLLTNDVHYLHLYVGGESVSTPAQLSIKSCPHDQRCVSRVPVPYNPPSVLPATAPVVLPARKLSQRLSACDALHAASLSTSLHVLQSRA